MYIIKYLRSQSNPPAVLFLIVSKNNDYQTDCPILPEGVSQFSVPDHLLTPKYGVLLSIF